HIYSAEDGVPASAPSAFCEDREGNLWIGFYDGGLALYAEGRFRLFAPADGLPDGSVRGLYLDHEGRLWIAANDGLGCLELPVAERPRFVVYGTAQGLAGNQATCITEDQWGRMYVGLTRGVDRLDPATGQIRHYTMADGLANNYVNISFRDRQGALWFGTLHGLSRLRPQPERPTSPPPILVNALRISGVAYPSPELGAAEIVGPELRGSQTEIQIDFVGLSFGIGESLRYQHKLEGTDADWSAPTNQRTVYYPH